MRSNLLKFGWLAASLVIGSAAHAAPGAAAPVPHPAAPAAAVHEPSASGAAAAPKIEGIAPRVGAEPAPGVTANPVTGSAVGGAYVPSIVPPTAGAPAYCNVPVPPPSCTRVQ